MPEKKFFKLIFNYYQNKDYKIYVFITKLNFDIQIKNKIFKTCL